MKDLRTACGLGAADRHASGRVPAASPWHQATWLKTTQAGRFGVARGLDRYMAEPMQIVEGNAIAPERPGHGVSLLWDKLAPLAL